MNIGLIIACEDKILSELKKNYKCFEERVGVYEIFCFESKNDRINVLKSGVGEICAASSAQLLISKYGVEKIINLGIVGGLKKEFDLFTVGYVKDVVHYDFDTTAVDGGEVGKYSQFDDVAIKADESLLLEAEGIKKLPLFRCASGDKFIDGSAKKKVLADVFGADICDMESAGILITCRNNGVPCLMIKAISDSADGGAEEFNRLGDIASEACLEILKGLLG